jgi:hypothetical protein
LEIGSLFVKIGFTAETDKLVKFNSSITALSTAFIAIRNLAQDAYGVMKKFMDASIDGAVNLNRLQEAWGIPSKEAQQWEFTAQLSNVGMTAQEADSKLQGLAQRIGDLRVGIGNPMGFNFFGVSAFDVKDAADLMNKIAERIQEWKKGGMWDAGKKMQAESVLGMLGLEGFLPVLEKSKAYRDKITKQFILSPDDLKKLDKANLAFTTFNLTMDKLRNSIMANLAPSITMLTNRLSAFITQNEPAIINFVNLLENKIELIIKYLYSHRKELWEDLKDIPKIFNDLAKTDFTKLIKNIDTLATSISKIANGLRNIKHYFDRDPHTALRGEIDLNNENPEVIEMDREFPSGGQGLLSRSFIHPMQPKPALNFAQDMELRKLKNPNNNISNPIFNIIHNWNVKPQEFGIDDVRSLQNHANQISMNDAQLQNTMYPI